jgi:hypothetical protein
MKHTNWMLMQGTLSIVAVDAAVKPPHFFCVSGISMPHHWLAGLKTGLMKWIWNRFEAVAIKLS